MTILRRHDLTDSSSASRRASTTNHPEHPVIYEYRLTGVPGWLVLVARPGTNLEAARRRIEHQFGADRVLEVREHFSNFTQQRET